MADHSQEMIGSENESHVKTSMETNGENTTDGSQVIFTSGIVCKSLLEATGVVCMLNYMNTTLFNMFVSHLTTISTLTVIGSSGSVRRLWKVV